ncbi:MAG: T9SS type A sorting domain-containing protein [Bacteroidales bacterium]|nr:T9SS type A sorting domain-containing protein [Bacteroidales bacterium]
MGDKYKFSNYPNPCSDQTKFSYSLPGKSHINLCIYNAYGQKVSTPVSEIQIAGEHQFDLYTSSLANGIYYYRLMIDQDLITGKLIVSR